jgi:RNA polymerase-associated protein LEO1
VFVDFSHLISQILKAESQNLKASTKLSQAREKIKRKYPLPVERRQLSTGYLEDALDEDDEDYRSNRGYEEDLEAEAQRERRILNAKKSHKGIPGRSSMTSARPSRRQMEYSESEREESEYETEEEEEEKSPARGRGKDSEDEYEEDAEEDEEERGKSNRYSDEDEEEEEVAGGRAEKDHRGSGRKRKGIESDEEESPPRKAPTHRRKAVIDDSDED